MNDGFDQEHNLSQVSIDVPSCVVELSPQQREIYQNLKSIGAEIAAYYLDGIKILHSKDLETAASLLAHTAREIDGGLRNILSIEKKEELRFVIRTLDNEPLTCEKGKEGTLKFTINTPGPVKVSYSRIGKHKASILQSLGIDDLSPLAERWINVTKRFAEFAHRHGAWKSPRRREEFEPLWSEFEDILANLVGNYLNLLSRVVDRILEYKKPTKEIREILPNLLESEARRKYFFDKLESPAWLKPLKEAGWFSPENNPAPQEDPDHPGYYQIPVWYALEYVTKVANNTRDHPCNETFGILVNIVNTIVDNHRKDKERIDNNCTDWRIIRIIGTLPVDWIKSQHITFMGTALKSRWGGTLAMREIAETILPKLVHNEKKDLTLELLEVILSAKVVNGQIIAIMEYWLKEALKAHGETIAKLCGVEAAEIALVQIRELITNSTHSFARIQMIEDRPSYAPGESYAELLVKFTSMMFRLTSPDSIAKAVADLLQEGISESNNNYAQRQSRTIVGLIALNAIKHHYANLKQLFWKWEGNPFDINYLKPGFYQLIEANCRAFDEREINRILDWIESLKYHTDRPKIVALRKREWLTALLKTKNEKIVSLYKKYKKKNPVEIEYPGCNFGIKIWAGSSSPLTVEELSAMSNTQIAEYLVEFKEPEIIIRWSDPTEEGLAETFKECVVTNPQRFTDDLQPFQGVKNFYQHWLLHGFLEAWRDKKEFDWTALLKFIHQILLSEQFWSEQYEDGLNCRNWVLAAAADLISEGTKDDTHAFDAQLLSLAEEILLVLVEKTEPSMFTPTDSSVDALSSDRGKVFSAMVDYALRFARLDNIERRIRWPQVIKADFTKRLDRSVEPSFEFSYTLGVYLSDLLYLDEEWVIRNLPHIFSQQDESHWQAAFSGYLLGSRIYENIYSLFKTHGHYRKALNTDFTDDEVIEILVDHICIGWIQDWETLDDDTNLIYQLVNGATPVLLSAVVYFFLEQSDKLQESDKLEKVKAYEKVKAKVRPTWRVLFQVLSKNSDVRAYQKVSCPLLGWLELVDTIDAEVLGWIKGSIEHIDKVPGYGMVLSRFIKALRKHAPQTPLAVGKIYLEIPQRVIRNLQAEKGDIIETIRILYNEGQEEDANKICNCFTETGVDFLRPVYEELRH